jgi:hypothetical protein
VIDIRYIENIVIGKPVYSPEFLFGLDMDDWMRNELEKTHFTNERYFPQIMIDIGLISSKREVRKNRPELCISLNEVTFFEVKWGKRKLWIQVGE